MKKRDFEARVALEKLKIEREKLEIAKREADRPEVTTTPLIPDRPTFRADPAEMSTRLGTVLSALTGPVGERGVQGEPGPVGAVGPVGERGEQGDRGIQGPVGERGERGPTGFRGSQGESGPQGDRGLEGRAGEAGTPGEGFTWRGKWQSGTGYKPRDCVEHQGSSFVCVAETSNTPGAAASGWDLMAKKGDDGLNSFGGSVDLSGLQSQIDAVVADDVTQDGRLDALEGSTVDAADVVVTPAGNLTAVEAQQALEDHQSELDDHDALLTGLADTSGTNTGDVTLAAVGFSPNGNGASLSSQALTLQPADGTNPGLLTAIAQAIGGVKTLSDPLLAASGTAAAPGLSFSAEPDCGMYKSGTNKIGFATGGSARWHVDASGNLVPDSAQSGSIGSAISTDRVNTVFCQEVHFVSAIRVGAAGNVLVAPTAGAGAGTYLQGQETDGATAVALVFNNTNSLANAAAKIASFQTGLTEKLHVSAAGTLRASDGTAALPALGFKDDLDNGMYRSGTDKIGFATAGLARWHINADGHLVPNAAGTLSIGTAMNTDRINHLYVQEVHLNTTIRQGAGDNQILRFDGGAGVGTTLVGQDANGATAVGVTLNNTNALTTTGARSALFQNGSVSKAAIDKDGAIQLNLPGGASQPAAAAGLRGTIWYTAGGAGVADKIEICAKSALDAYSWVPLSTLIV